MAKKRKKRLPARRRSRRSAGIGGMNFDHLMPSLITIGGGVGSTLIDRILPSEWEPKAVNGVKILVGLGAPLLFKDPQTRMMVAAGGAGLATVAANDLLKDMGLFSGVADDPDEIEDLAVVLPEDTIEADVLGEDLDIINADVLGDDIDVVNGMDELD